MGRITNFTGMAFAAAAFISTPALAQDQGLACFEQSYTPEQMVEIGALSPDAGAGVEGVQALVGQVVAIVQPTFAACTESEGWSPEQAQQATVYELGRVNSMVIREAGMLTEDELARFDAALADPANANVITAMENIVRSSMGGGGMPSADDQDALGNFIVNNGFDIGNAGTDTGELFTLLLSFIAVQNIGETEFAALEG